MKSGRIYVRRKKFVDENTTVESIVYSNTYDNTEHRKRLIKHYADKYNVDNDRTFITVMPDEEVEELPERKPFKYSPIKHIK